MQAMVTQKPHADAADGAMAAGLHAALLRRPADGTDLAEELRWPPGGDEDFEGAVEEEDALAPARAIAVGLLMAVPMWVTIYLIGYAAFG